MKLSYKTVSLGGYSGIKSYTINLIKSVITDPNVEVSLYTTFKQKEPIARIFGAASNLQIHNILPHPRILGNSLKPLTQKYTLSKYASVSQNKGELVHWLYPEYSGSRLDESIITIHDAFVMRDEPWAMDMDLAEKERQKRVIIDSVKRAKHIITPSESVKNDLLDRFPDLSPNKVSAIWVGAERFNLNDAAKDSIIDEEFFLSVGQLNSRKNYANTLKAYRNFIDNSNSKAKFVFVGSPRTQANEIEFNKTIDSLKLNDKIVFLKGANTARLIQLYSKAMALVFCSYAEGFGTPIIEAFNMNCPVITSDLSSMKEVAGVAALKADPNNVESIAEAMYLVDKSTNLREVLKRKGSERAKLFSWLKTGENYIEIYKQICNK
jgi:glycosyltransferase involved in cell wall biosynthesis